MLQRTKFGWNRNLQGVKKASWRNVVNEMSLPDGGLAVNNQILQRLVEQLGMAAKRRPTYRQWYQRLGVKGVCASADKVRLMKMQQQQQSVK